MKKTELTTLTKQQLSTHVAGLPPEERAGFSKAATAASKHLRDSKTNYAKAFDISCAVVENWWRLGLEIPRLGIKPGPQKKHDVENSTSFLSDLGITRDQSSYAQKLATKSKAELDEYLDSIRDEKRYKLPTLFRASGANGAHVSYNTGENEWYTPLEFIEAARKVMGSITLDPASSKIANKTVKARRFFTKDDNGLLKKWGGTVWLNPPYSSDMINQFCDKLVESLPTIDQAIVLVNNATDTRWFQTMVASSQAVCFPGGRIRFLDPKGNPGQPLQGQVILYYGMRTKTFSKVFKSFGWIGVPNGQ
jgi:phage N-6-adenine-methyltransferase